MGVQSLGREDPLKDEMATHSSILSEKSHGLSGLARYSPQGRRVGHDWVTKHTHGTIKAKVLFEQEEEYRRLHHFLLLTRSPHALSLPLCHTVEHGYIKFMHDAVLLYSPFHLFCPSPIVYSWSASVISVRSIKVGRSRPQGMIRV